MADHFPRRWLSSGPHDAMKPRLSNNHEVTRFTLFMRRMMRDIMDPQRSLPIVLRTRMLFGLLLSFLYVVSPIDILPEALLGVAGFLGDLLIVVRYWSDCNHS